MPIRPYGPRPSHSSRPARRRFASFVLFCLLASLGSLVATTSEASASPCPDGSKVVKGSCELTVAAIPLPPRCIEGQLTGDVCQIVGTPPGPRCPDFADPSVFPLCAVIEPAIPGPPICPPGARGNPIDGCFILMARIPSPDGAVCPVDTVEVENGCKKSIDPIPAGFFCLNPDAILDGDRCLIPLPIEFGCEPGFSLIGNQCIRFEPPVREFVCPPDATETPDGCELSIRVRDLARGKRGRR